MASSVKTSLKWNQAKLNGLNKRTQQGLVMMANAVANQAKQNAPHDTGALRNSIRIKQVEGGVEVIAGGNMGGKSVPYAKRRKGDKSVPYAKRREYENKKNPHTKFYMERALNTVLQSNWKQKYFGGITK